MKTKVLAGIFALAMLVATAIPALGAVGAASAGSPSAESNCGVLSGQGNNPGVIISDVADTFSGSNNPGLEEGPFVPFGLANPCNPTFIAP